MAKEGFVDEGQQCTWECPICGSTQSYLDAGGSACEKAKGALLSHVRAVDDPGHGPKQAYPDGFDPDAVDAYIDVGRGGAPE